MNYNFKKINLFVLISIVVFLISIGLYYTSNKSLFIKPLTFDEVDYRDASSKGVWHNASGKQTLSLTEFIQLGILKLNKDTAAIENFIATHYHAADDVFMLRHYHPVLPVYYWKLFLDNNPEKESYNLRLSNFILVGLYILIFLVALFLDPRIGIKGLKSVWLYLFLSILLLSDLFNHCFSSITFHTFFAIFAIFSCSMFSRFVTIPTIKNAVLLGISLSLLLLTLESSVFLIFGLLISTILFRKYKVFKWKYLFIIILSSLTLTTIVWPSFLFKGELLKSIGMYVFRIFGKSNLEYKSVSYVDNWFEIINASPFLFFLILLSIILSVLALIKNKDKITAIIALTGLLFALIMTPFILNSTYIFAALSVLIYAGITNLINLGYKFHYLKLSLVIIAVFVIALNSYQGSYKERNFTVAERNIFDKELKIIKTLSEDNKLVLIHSGHVYRYYLNRNNIITLDIPEKNNMEFSIRWDYLHSDISDDIKNHKYNAVVLPKVEQYNDLFKKLDSWGYYPYEFPESQLIYFVNINGLNY